MSDSRSPTPGTLSHLERQDLDALEARVGAGLGGFVQVGLALLEIKDRRLYRAEHATFEAYLAVRWGLGRSQAYRLIDAAGVAAVVSPDGDDGPQRESQMRPLVGLPPAEQRAAWQAATRDGQNPTGAQVQAAAAAVLARLSPERQREVIEAEERAVLARAAQRRGPPANPREQGRLSALRFLARARKQLLRDPDAEAIVEALDALVVRVEAHRGSG